MEPSDNGAGGLTYFVVAQGKKYVVKYPSDNEMNHPKVEISVCETLLKKGISACIFLANKQGKKVSTDENGRKFTVQDFYEGDTYGYHEAPTSLQVKSAKLLAKIHVAIKDMENIPVGIGKEFFMYRQPAMMKESYTRTLNDAIENHDFDIAENIRSNMRIAESMCEYKFNLERFTCGNSHGDYMISQLIWKDEEINGIIDWTCACRHPYIWEIVRSYVFMAPEVHQGLIDIDGLLRYLQAYLEIGSLNSYDIENVGNLFYYFLAVCNFYDQYYASISKNRSIYLEQANMASNLLVWFEEHIDELNEKLRDFNMQIMYQNKLAGYYDSEGRLSQYPSKRPMRQMALSKIANCFEKDRKYTEKEVNEIIRSNISFTDVELIRREMYQCKLIGRLRDGSEYWRE